MTPAERFVVVAGVSLLVFNLILFSLCLSLVYDSKAARNNTAQLIAMTGRLLEHHQATPAPMAIPSNPASSRHLETTASSQEAKVAEGCPLLLRSTPPTTSQPEVHETHEVTGVALSTEPGSENSSHENIKSIEDRMLDLERTVKKLLEKLSSDTTQPPVNVRRRRNGGGEGTSALS